MGFRTKKDAPASGPGLPRDVLGFLGEGNSIRGEIDLVAGFRVDGALFGRVSSPSTLVVGPTGTIDSADLSVKTLSVSGAVRGRLRIGDQLEVRRGGRVLGDVILERPGALVLEPGSIFHGTLRVAASEDAGAPRNES
jgi:cytoskeletal protein CcmA (bactofilin family)